MTDTRETWEIVASVWTSVAAAYLHYLDCPNPWAYEQAFGVTNGGLREWATGQIQRAVAKANAVLTEYGQSRIEVDTWPQVYPRESAGLGRAGAKRRENNPTGKA